MPTAAEVKTLGDATADQRTELRALIGGKAVDDQWVRSFYAAVRRAGGLSRRAADDALIYLRTLVDDGEPIPAAATPEQGAAMAALRETRLIPRPLAKTWMDRLTAGELSYQLADRTIREWVRMPPNAFITAGDRRSAWSAPDGYFALRRADDSVRCYRIHTLPASGARVVQQINGEGITQRFKLYGVEAATVMRAIAANPADAARLYARTRGRCCDCNQRIGDDETKPGWPQGYGPDCWANRQSTEGTR